MTMPIMKTPDIYFFECQGEHFALNIQNLVLVHLSGKVYAQLESSVATTSKQAFESLLVAVPLLTSTGENNIDNAILLEAKQQEPYLGVCLIMTHDCNLQCIYCYDQVNRQLNQSGSLDIDKAKMLLDLWSKNYKRISIWFFGGEPLLHYDKLVQIVKYAEELAHRHQDLSIGFSITTNGTLLTKSRTEFLADHGFFMLISCDGLDDNGIRLRFPRSDNLQRERERYVKILSMAVDIFKPHPERLAVRSTITSSNVDSLYENFISFYTIGLKKMFFAPAIEVDRPFTTDDAKLWKQELSRLITQIVKINEPVDWSLLPQLESAIASIRERLYIKGQCAVLNHDPNHSVCAVDIKGDLFPCQRLAILGNKGSDVLLEAIQDHSLLQSVCSQCWARNICGESVCPYINKVCSGNAAIPCGPLCDVQRYIVELACWATWYQNNKYKGASTII